MPEKEQRSIVNALMLIDTERESFSIQDIDNRRFMYSPQSGELILGKQYRGRKLYASHAEEHGSCGAKAAFDSFVRGWVGTSRQYPNGVIHFAPSVDSGSQERYNRAFDTLKMFRENGGKAGTVIRGFGARWEQPFSDIIPFEENTKMRP